MASFISANSPLFEEYLGLLGDDVAPVTPERITSDDALIVIDMQADFFVRNPYTNPDGGRFGVDEGEAIVEAIVLMMNHFGECGATVVATRDYHPVDHVCFNTEGGHLPAHCVEGTPGTFLLPPIADAMRSLLVANGPEKAVVAFKGFHEDVDSFGALPYANEYASTRIATRSGFDINFCSPSAAHGCSRMPWTGCLALKQSGILHAYRNHEDADMNSPPDLLAAVDDGKRRGMLSLPEVLKGKKRLFMCGVALDFCVLDSCINAKVNGFDEVFYVLDATRPAHIPGVGLYGSGFLSDPAEVKSKIKGAGVSFVSYENLMPKGAISMITHIQPVPDDAMRTFPESLGPLALEALSTEFTANVYGPAEGSGPSATRKYQLHLAAGKLVALKLKGIDGLGVATPPAPIPPNWEEAPDSATQICWGFPIYSPNAAARHSGLSFLEMSASPELRFAAYGGFLLLDKDGTVVLLQSLSFDLAQLGEDLVFEKPATFPPRFEVPLRAEGRLQPITIPLLWRLGAREFAWICPGEELSLEGDTWMPSEYGGFMYVMANQPPVLFKVVPNPEERDETSLGTVKATLAQASSMKKANMVAAAIKRMGTLSNIVLPPAPPAPPSQGGREGESRGETTTGGGSEGTAPANEAPKAYLERNREMLERSFTEAMRAAVRNGAENPLAFVGEYLSKQAATGVNSQPPNKSTPEK